MEDVGDIQGRETEVSYWQLSEARGASMAWLQPAREEEDASELKLGEEFNKATCLSIGEVKEILLQKKESIQSATGDESIQLNPVFEKSLDYVCRFSRYQNKEASKQVRELLNQRKLHQFEICVLANLCPDTAAEAKALVPTLARRGRFTDDEIDRMVQDLAKLRRFE
eukprot:TRINITY_DN6264_c0_g2_i1.p2 TRINITY_DN6264_c0_g2~~TRINITY_DN6264_c0_g2_i1.p2  ORF type:complete len:168 (-),score=34.75 TRINITY_DN6264_c0_g2_i1:490-993(-)